MRKEGKERTTKLQNLLPNVRPICFLLLPIPAGSFHWGDVGGIIAALVARDGRHRHVPG